MYIFYEKKVFRKKSLGGTPDKKLEKFFFEQNGLVYMSVHAVFDGDYEYDIVLVETLDKKRKSQRIPVYLTMKIPEISKHFHKFPLLSDFISKNNIIFVISMKNCVY